MRFALIPKSAGILLNNSVNECHDVYCKIDLSPYDDDPSSKAFVDELDRLFMEKYGNNATNCLQLNVCGGSRKLYVLGLWREEDQTIGIQLFGQILDMLVEVLGTTMRVRVEVREMEVKYTVGYKGDNPPLERVQAKSYYFSPEVVSFPPEHVGTTEEMAVKEHHGKDLRYSCVDNDVQIPHEWKLYMKQSDLGKTVFCGQIKFEVSTCGFSYILPSVSEKRSMDLHDTNKKMLDEGTFPDVILVGMNRTELKCHRNILAARSPVFATLFQNESPVPTSTWNKIEMLEMSDKALTAFLAYLYYGDMVEASENSEIAFELFRAGHKYEIQPLVESVKLMFLNKKKEWFDVTVAVRLILFLGEVGECEQLKVKCAQVMKLKRHELVAFEKFLQFSTVDHEVEMEL